MIFPREGPLADRYRLRGPLGAGGMGTVWLAHDELLDRDVAVKEVILPAEADDTERARLCELVIREARIAARVRHPGIVTVHDVISQDGKPWLVMEVLYGRSLQEAVAEEGALPPARVASFGAEVLAALTFAHEAGVLHHDVKPANVFLHQDGHAVLTDFGVATLGGQATITSEGVVVGSPGYIAPERLRGEPGGPESDLWSFGAVLYTAVEGVPPHSGGTPMAVLAAVLTQDPRPPVLAGSLAPVLMSLLDQRPEARPDAASVAAMLAEVAADPSAADTRAPIPAGTPDPGGAGSPRESSGPAPRPGRRRTSGGPAAVLAGTVVACVLAAATGFALGGPGAAAVSVPTVRPPAADPRDEPGRFGLPVKLCELLTPEQVRELLPKLTDTAGAWEGTSCGWTVKGPGHRYRKGEAIPAGSDTVQRFGQDTVLAEGSGMEVKVAGDEPWGMSPNKAHHVFVNERSKYLRPSSWVGIQWPQIGLARATTARTSAATPLTGVGEEAFLVHTNDRWIGGRICSDVTFRVDNLVLTVLYCNINVADDAEIIERRARTAARWVVAGLNRAG
ncbi:protein kinase domain-containing protein [Streptosporangium sp. CA-115845]|uniref:serine/threonine-protein kinase n=1 Tax=Streptosporangium sp. CA-115845 TaxID=3240071 RepID=UPI003D8C7088